MASPDVDSHWPSSAGETFCGFFNMQLEETNPAYVLPVLERPTSSSMSIGCNIPKPPPLPGKTRAGTKYPNKHEDRSAVPNQVRDMWDKVFKEGYGADVHIITEGNSYIPAHCSILSIASPVLRSLLQKSKAKDHIKCIKIPGVPYDAVYTFIRFLYSSCYEREEMKKFVLHLLVLSHSYSVPSLKEVCIYFLEQDWLTKEKVIDVLQLARSCDAPRLAFICVRMVVKDFKTIASTEGWKVMKRANPALEQELLESVVEADSRKEERLKKTEEKKVYLQLHEAMEALIHICRDGCRTIGPRDKVLKGSQVTCSFPACRGLETLVRHFSNCKTRVPGGCVHCKRMWQLLELHSRMCNEPDSCKVPLCKFITLTTHFPNSSEQHKPIYKLASPLQVPRKFSQRVSFSTSGSDPPDPDSDSPIDAGSSIRKPISLWPGTYHSPVTNALWEARSIMFENRVDGDGLGELGSKTPSQSRTSILYQFSSDLILREQYRSPWNKMRIGKLLEDLDALAGTIALKHCANDDGTRKPLLLVTASVDKMVLRKPICIETDVNIAGSVTWVGRSSMEIQLEVSQLGKENPETMDSVALVANFTFVARDLKTGKSAPINHISPETEKEKILWEEAEERNKMRKKKKAEYKTNMNSEDVNRLQALLSEGRVFCDLPALADRDSILIKDTYLENSFMCQPQQRNIYGRIFGGFLMQKAFELAFSTTYAFAGIAPQFVEVDHVDFLKPVDVGNFLRFKSCILFTELENPDKPMINVEVVAHVTRPEHRCSEVSNKFYFTFTVPPGAMKNGLRIRNVGPATEEEGRRVLERMDAEGSKFTVS